jgi:predicted membrane channel-forming protein YqfA (hemolysin III family)
MSWYRTYTRTVGRGYTLDDPDTVAYILTTLSSFIYITYNVQILVHPEEYGYNQLYFYGDIIYSVGAVFYLWANLRDDGWLWWMPVAGQYGIAAGRIETGRPTKVGLPHLLICGNEPCTRCCCPSIKEERDNRRVSIITTDEKAEYINNNNMKNNNDNVFTI